MKTLQLTVLVGISLFVGFNAFGSPIKHDTNEFNKKFKSDTAMVLTKWQADRPAAALIDLNTIGIRIGAEQPTFKRTQYQNGFIAWLNSHLDILGRQVDSFADAMQAVKEKLQTFGIIARDIIRESIYSAADSL